MTATIDVITDRTTTTITITPHVGKCTTVTEDECTMIEDECTMIEDQWTNVLKEEEKKIKTS